MVRRGVRMVGTVALAAALAAPAALTPASARVNPVAFAPTAASDTAAARAVLDGYLQRIAPSLVIERCATVLGRNPGTVEAIYTAACKLRGGGWVVLCGDIGIGEFALAPASDPATPRSAAAMPGTLIDFANRNCGGG